MKLLTEFIITLGMCMFNGLEHQRDRCYLRVKLNIIDFNRSQKMCCYVDDQTKWIHFFFFSFKNRFFYSTILSAWIPNLKLHKNFEQERIMKAKWEKKRCQMARIERIIMAMETKRNIYSYSNNGQTQAKP